MQYTMQIKSRQPAVTSVVADVEIQLAANGVNPDQTSEVCLVLAEALNNVVEHAYRYSEDGDIEIEVSLINQNLTINISDFGPEFTAPEPQPATDPSTEALEDLPEGGFGWRLIQMLSDEVSVKRKNNRNHLKLIKILNGAAL